MKQFLERSIRPAAGRRHKPDDEIAVSVVIPAYFSEQTVAATATRTVAVLEREGVEFEVIVVDDGSGDGTWRQLLDLHSRWPHRVLPIQLAQNFGQHNAILCGFRHARGQYLVTIDDDLQQDPGDIPRLLDHLTQNRHDIVYGSYARKCHSAWRNLASSLVNAGYRSIFGSSVTVTSFRALRRDLATEIFGYSSRHFHLDGLLARYTSRIGAIPVAHYPRSVGASRYTFRKLVRLALSLFGDIPLHPLRYALLPGLTMSAIGLSLLLWNILLLSHSSPSLVSPFLVGGLLMAGVQLSAFGVIADFLRWRQQICNSEPQYVIRQTLPLSRTKPSIVREPHRSPRHLQHRAA